MKSQALRDSARDKPCTLRLECCNFNPATSVLAHVPCGQKGMGMKGPDYLAVIACSDCHDALDGRSRRATVTKYDITRALAETWAYWLSVGLVSIKGAKR